ncbi:MAG: hypothetical protein AMXMBFR82_08180 [Candidatus Hydrogenedentota bacterium]
MLALSRILLLAIIAALALLAFRTPRRFIHAVRDFLLTPMAPANLAVFRIVVFALVLQKTNLDDAVWLAGIPPELMDVPWGMGWLVSLAPFDPETVRYAGWALIIVCALGMVGFCSRTCAVIAAVLGMYVLGVPQCVGKVGHYNHLIWFLMILAASPCGDALSVDALIRSRSRKRLVGISNRSSAYGFPIRVAEILIGLAYFFPGFWKLWTSGIDWITGDNLTNLVLRYHAMQDMTRGQWILEFPILLNAGGAAVILFELTFLFALFRPRSRVLAIVAGVAFHLANWYLLNILFHPLLACYVLFIDWGALARRSITRTSAAVEGGSELAAQSIPVQTTAVSALVVLAVSFAGAKAETQGWPFACYPTFAEVMRSRMYTAVLEATVNEKPRTIDLTPLRLRVGGIRWERWIRDMANPESEQPQSMRLIAFARWCARESGVADSDAHLVLSVSELDVISKPWTALPSRMVVQCTMEGP